MFDALATVTVRFRWLVLALTGLGLVAAVLIGGDTQSRLSNGGVTDPAAESSRAQELLDSAFAAGQPNFVLLVDSGAGTAGGVDAAAVGADGAALARRLAAEPGVAAVRSYWTGGADLRSRDGRYALVTARITGSDDDVADRVGQLSDRYGRDSGAIAVDAGGAAETRRQVDDRIAADLVRAEAIVLPITLVVLVLVFGSLVAAATPVVIGLIAILGTTLVLRVVVSVVPVSVFALNLTTALGLGLAIDYSLLVLRRYREELAAGAPVAEAIRRTLNTAGRTILFSALTVALSLGALLVFPMYFLRSFAYAGTAVVLLAAAGAVVTLPALLAVLGTRVNRYDLRAPVLRRLRARRPAAGRVPFAGRLAAAVVRRPLAITAGVVGLLAVLALPLGHLRLGVSDDRVLPTSAGAHQVQEVIRDGFAVRDTSTLQIAVDGMAGGAAAHRADIAGYAAALSRVPGVERVQAVTGDYAAGRQVAGPGPQAAAMARGEAGYLRVTSAVEAMSPAGEELVRAVRAVPTPLRRLVAGSSAQLVDSKRALIDGLLPAGLVIGVSTLLLLFLFTGSVLLPVKALLVNLASLAATFGALVWIFQDGNLRGLFGDFQVSGFLEMSMPVLIFCVAFGVSMDYEVFLLGRIREEWVRTGDNTAATVVGLRRVAGLVSAAAVLLTIVLVGIGTSSVVNAKLLGIGLALAVLLDATVIRCLLVPAMMQLAGRANWWAPRPLRWLHGRVGLHEGVPAGPPAAPVPDPRPVAAEDRSPVGVGAG